MKKLATFFLFIILISSEVFSQEKYYNLETCLKIAVRNNFDLRSSNVQINAADAGKQQAFGSYLPSINGSMGYSRHLNTNTGDYTIQGIGPNQFNMGVNAGWLIFDGFGREASYKIAENNLKAAEYNLENTQKYIRYQVYYNYINVVRNAQIVKIRRENLKTGKQELERITARHEAGIIPIAAVYSQEADLGNRESDLIVAENNLDISRANLLTIMGLDPTTDCIFLESSLPNEITDENINSFASVTGSFKKATQKAFEARNDYLSSKENTKSAESNIRVAYAAYSPTLDANLSWNWSQYEFANVGKDGNSYAGVTLRVPIFNNFRANNGVQNAKLNLTQQEVYQSKLELSIKQELQTAFLRLKAAQKMLEVTEKSQKSASQNHDATKERFELGSASITDLTLANMQLITAQINRVDAVYSYIAAQKEVLYSMGVLDE